MITRGKDIYFFAINKVYIWENSQFFNIFQEPF